jgi:hypothetical protein
LKQIILALVTISLISMTLAAVRDVELVGDKTDVYRLSQQTQQDETFTFVRLIYNGRVPGYLKNWYTDYPTGDENLIAILERVTGLDVAPKTRAIAIDNPALYKYPFVYSTEAGQMVLSEFDAWSLRDYLDRGGFWMIDDFWGNVEWGNFEEQIKKVFPDRKIQELPTSHPLFHVFHDIDNVLQVPNIGYAYGRDIPTWEQDGITPHVRAILDDKGRVQVLIHWNTDLMDASEWADDPLYPARFSEYAYKMFTNCVIYSLSH